MNYELAKELREAGFPQKEPNEMRFLTNGDTDHIFFPSLSELIEACGEKFGSLVRYGNDTWRVFKPRDSKRFDPLFIDAKTPEEAVARLWLSLNKK